MFEKIKVSDVAKDLSISANDIVDVLAKFGHGNIKTRSTLDMEQLDLVFEFYTQRYMNESAFDVYQVRPVKQKPVGEEQKNENASASASDLEEQETQENVVIEKKSRVVDTRQYVVDLEKLDTEKRAEELVDASVMEKQSEKKQKIKKGTKTQKDHFNPKDLDKNKTKEKVKVEKQIVAIPDEISVGDLAERMSVSATEIIKKLMALGIMASISQFIDFDTAALIAEDLGAIVEKEIIVTEEDILFNDIEDEEKALKQRPPVVVVMGHVDHGKTSLLDAIKNTNVIDTEAGGITQHIGAYSVMANGREITFLDTPGHEAFTAMRARGAQVTDIAIIVVAADDGIMPQTIEAINHAKAAEVGIIVAINKIDKEGANPDRVKQELTEQGLVVEEWGGDTICVEVSAKQNINIDGLLEMILLLAEMKELKANPDRKAKGTVIEAKLDKGRGPVATVLVQNGTLNSGDIVVAGTSVGRVRAMFDSKGNKAKTAGPSVPVEIIGLSEVPEGGDVFYVVTDERKAREVVEKRKQKMKEETFASRAKFTLDDLFSKIQEGDVKDLNIIVKADVQGSVEAVKQSLEKISNDEVRVKVIHGNVGAVTESDVMLAYASNAIIVGFNVRPTNGAQESADLQGVDIRMYRVIYEAIEEIEAAMKGMLTPKFKEVVQGHAEIRQTFKVSGIGTIGGCYVTDGKIVRNSSARIVRNGIVIHEGELASLKRFKDDAKEVSNGYECGIGIEKFNDIKEGDVIESYYMQEIER